MNKQLSDKLKKEFMQFSWRVTLLSMNSYFIAGILALVFMNYREQFKSDSLLILMRSVDSPMIAVGPLLQIISGFLCSLFLFHSVQFSFHKKMVGFI